MIYLFTNGFAYQIGGFQDEAFRSKYFRELLLDICKLEMYEQREMPEKKFEEWKGNIEQVDDVLVIGLKV